MIEGRATDLSGFVRTKFAAVFSGKTSCNGLGRLSARARYQECSALDAASAIDVDAHLDECGRVVARRPPALVRNDPKPARPRRLAQRREIRRGRGAIGEASEEVAKGF